MFFTIDNIKEVIKFFRPEFYNKITWVLVIAGLGLIGTPLIEKIINAFLEKTFSLAITDTNDAIIGVVLVCLGLFYNLLALFLQYFFNQQKANVSEHYCEIDRALFVKFLQCLPSNGSVEFVNNHSFGNSFNFDNFNQLFEFYHTWNNAEYEFINPNLENLKKALFDKIAEFVDFSSLYTYGQRSGLYLAIPDAYLADEMNLPQHVHETIQALNKLGREVYEMHQNLVREAKKELSV
jgi:hypothetical protein